MTSSNVYKSFDSSQFLFEMIWKIFPTLKTRIDGDKIINNLIISSNEFCDLRKTNFFNLKYFSEGGFGKVGTIGINSETLNNKQQNLIKAAIFSFKMTEEDNVFFTNVIIKIGINQSRPSIYKTHDSSISITDPLSDMIFGSILGHLFDIGVCPFITKYFGTYLCGDNETSMLIEASNYELRKKLSRFDKKRLTVLEFKNVLSQFMYGLYILKLYFGTVHFDSHLRNIMLTDLENNEYMFHGRYLKEIDFLLLETGIKDINGNGIIIVLRRTKYLLKLIDYGCMLFCFDRSIFSRFQKDLRIETDNKNIESIGASEALNLSKINKSYANTVDFMFSIINMYEYMEKGLDSGYTGDIVSEQENIEYLNIINSIMFNITGISMKEFLYKNPQLKIQKINNTDYDWFMRNHNCGFLSNFENPQYLVETILKLCTGNQIVKNFPFKDTKYYGNTVSFSFLEDSNDFKKINVNNSLFISINMSDYLKRFNRFEKLINYEEKCRYNKMYCDIKTVNNQPPFETFIPGKKYTLSENKKYRVSKTLITDFDFDVSYKDYNTWLNYKNIPKNIIGTNIKEILTFFIRFKNSNINENDVNLYYNDNLTKTSGIKLPICYSILNNRNILEPIGFFANKSPVKFTNGNIPVEYNEFLAVLLMDEINGMLLEKYTDFISRHVTKTTNFGMEYIDIPIQLKFGEKYNWATTIGPIFIWNKELLFTEKNIIENNLGMLFGGTSKGKYFMNGSTEIESQLVYISKDGIQGFLFIEGNGFLSHGMDKFTTARFCKSLDLDFAVSIMSGPDINILCKTTNNSEIWLSKLFNEKFHSVVLDFNMGN